MGVVRASEGNVVQSKINAIRAKYGSAVGAWGDNSARARSTKTTAGHMNTWIDRMASLANSVRSRSNYDRGYITRPSRISSRAIIRKNIVDSLVNTGNVCLTYCNYRECHHSECNRSECNASECNYSESERGAEHDGGESGGGRDR